MSTRTPRGSRGRDGEELRNDAIRSAVLRGSRSSVSLKTMERALRRARLVGSRLSASPQWISLEDGHSRSDDPWTSRSFRLSYARDGSRIEAGNELAGASVPTTEAPAV